MLPLSPNATGALLALAAFFVFSTHDALIKVLAATYSPVQIVFSIALYSFPLLLLMLARDREQGTLIPRHPRWVLARGLTVALSSTSAFYAFSVLPMAQVYAILFGTPLLITLLSVPVLGEKVGWRRGVAVVVGMCGVLVVLRPGASELSLGHLAALASAMLGAGTSVITRKVGRAERSAVLLTYALMGNFVLMGAALPLVYKPMSGPDLAVMVAVAVMAFAAMQLVILAYRRAEAVVVAPMQYSQIVWAVVYGTLFFGEWPDLWTLLGAGIVIASGVYIVLREARARVSETRPVLSAGPRPETSAAVRNPDA